MIRLPLAVWLLAGAMLAAAGATLALTPRAVPAGERASLDLEALIPAQFGDWRIDPTLAPIAPAPDVKAALEKFYASTVARTYVDRNGARIMLSVAYGAEQTDSLRVHQPEGCYVGQGFDILAAIPGAIATAFGELPVTRLVAAKGARSEPITYWIMVGDRTVLGQWQLKLTQLGYGLTGRIPDGILVRVSSISRDRDAAFDDHARFINAMLAAIAKPGLPRLIGRLAG